MDYNIITARPEAPITETWLWLTDLMEAFDGSEDSLPLLRYPKRNFQAVYAFDDKAEIRKIIGSMFTQFDNLVKLPLFQYMVKLKEAVDVAATSVSVNATRSDLREEYTALIIEGETFEEVTIATIVADTVTFVDPLENAYTKRALLVPMTQAYMVGGPTLSRVGVDNRAIVNFNFREYKPLPPFVNPLNEATLATFDDLPIVPGVPYGNAFDQILDSGGIINEFIGIPDLQSPFLLSKFTYNVTFLCHRTTDLASWETWVAFAEYAQGSQNPFLLPTNREDLEVVTPVAGGGTQVVVAGDLYSENYWGADAFRRIVIKSDAGTAYGRVTGIADVGGNDRLTFTPALPGGAGWDSNQKISFLLKVRNATDKITVKHNGLDSDITMSLRTVA